MNGVSRRNRIVHSIENVLLITLVVEHGELWRIEEATGIESVGLKKVAPFLAAIRQIEAACRGSEGTIGCADTARGLGHALPGARGRHNHQAGLAAVFGWRRAADHFDRLN